VCPYSAHCSRDLTFPEYPVDELPSLRKKKRAVLARLSVERIEDIPTDFALSEMQKRVWTSVATGEAFVSPDLSAALEDVKYPIHHLDFETFMPALPRYVGTRPYQALPFQWSNHIEAASGQIQHDEYLCPEDIDPREAFATMLLDTLGSEGTICIYSGYEVTVIRSLAKALPHLALRLLTLEARIWDLCGVIKRNFYHPQFHGSFSLKQVLPVLVPSMSYATLAVGDGEAASLAYVESIMTSDPQRRQELQAGLLAYCGQDTMAMVELRRALRQRCAAMRSDL